MKRTGAGGTLDGGRVTVEPDIFKSGMRLLAGAVTLVTTRLGAQRQGLTASAVCSLSAAPPLLIACVNRGASAHDAIRASGAFAVNVLTEPQAGLARLFSDTAAIDRRFAEGHWLDGATGSPLLADALVAFDCALEDAIEKASHSIFIGRVEGVHLGGAGRPLLYFEGRFTAALAH